MKTNILRLPGLAERIRERLRALDFWRAEDNRPDVRRFCATHGWDHTYLYRWLEGVTPSYDHLDKLAHDLDCPLAWLMLGDAPAKPKRPRAGHAVGRPQVRRRSRRIMSSRRPILLPANRRPLPRVA